MKRKTLLGGLSTLLLFTVCMVTYSCRPDSSSQVEDEQVCVCDTVYTDCADSFEAIVNPNFSTPEEVFLFQNTLKEQFEIERLFREMPLNTLSSVANVCLKKNSSATMKDIVDEYTKNRAVYDNLSGNKSEASQQSENNKREESAGEEQHRPAVKVSYRYDIDTINGVPKRVIIKEERYEE